MKYIILLYFIFFSFSYSQPKDKNIKVDYKQYCNTDFPVILHAVLMVNDNVGIYQDKLSMTERWTEKPTDIELSVEKLRTTYEPYLKIDRNKKEMFFFDQIGKNIFLVKDNYTDLKWDITKETKEVAGYICTKATTNFRGRQWIAWFAPEIPVALGPWKLHGLPGLILEASDSTKTYTIIAEKVEYSKSDIFAKDFITLMNVKSKKPVPIQKFMQDGQEAQDNVDKVLMADKNFTLEVKKEPRNGEELIYEWEQ